MSGAFYFDQKMITNDVVVWEMGGQPTVEEWKSFLASAATWLSEQEIRGKRWGVIIDPSRMQSVPTEIRRMAGQWRADNMPLIANTCTCGCYVAESAVIRGAITAVLWLAAPVIPVSVRGNQDEAHQWVLTKLGEALTA